MIITGFRNKLKQAGFYIPFTLYFFLFVIAGTVAWNMLHNNQNENDTAFADIFTLLLKVAFFFGAILLGLALLSVLTSLIFFLYKRKKTGIDFRISTDLLVPVHN